MIELLEQVGLTKSEIKVYFALLELGSSSTGAIVDKSGASSSKIYEILERLIQKGLVSYVLKGKIKYFEASSPERIIDYINEKEKELKQQKQGIEKILPELMLKKELSKFKQDATIYKGMKGLETAFFEAVKTMKKGDIVHVTGVPSRSKKVNLFFVRWNKFRAEHGVKMKILFNESARGELQTKPENNPLAKIKYMPEEIMTPAAINVFNEKTIIFPSETEKQPILITINSKEVAESFKAQFDILWNQQTIVYTGLTGPKIVLKDMVKTGKEVLAFGLEENKLQKNVPDELNEFIKDMEGKKIPEKLLFKKGSEIVVSKYSKVKFLPKEFFNPLHIEIYGNKVAITDWTEPITTIIMEKTEIAEAYRKYFDLLWKMAK
ncbi:MAG: helix-turn-helix domain-containing protein [DPANN group archaeon]|nr:helix-turn-helix domain-containing protein [DPANN group archaeon]